MTKEEKKLNLPSKYSYLVDKLFSDEDDEWTWFGLAEYFVTKTTDGDIEEFIMLLNEARGKI